MTSNLNLMKP